MNKSIIQTLIIFSLIISCNKKTDYYYYPTFSSDDYVNAVIEIPAGTNKKFEYNKRSQTFEIDQKNGKDRIVQFLPYVGNYGYIPSTFSDPKKGGDGDALDVLVLSEGESTGSIIKVLPIAMLKLIDDGEMDYKIIAIPMDVNKQIINTKTYLEFSNKFPEIKQIVELWFLNYNKKDTAKIEGWSDEKMALQEIKNCKN